MRVTLYQALLGTSLLGLLACNGGGDSKAPTIVTGTGTVPSATVAVFDPASSAILLPNVLLTASSTSITYTATHTAAAGTVNISPATPSRRTRPSPTSTSRRWATRTRYPA